MFSRNTGLLLAVVFVSSITAISPVTRAQSQTRPADQSETVRLRTELIQVQVVVTDKQGKVIEDLKKDDFELLEQGRPQEVSFFSLERIRVRPAVSSAKTPNPIPAEITPTGSTANSTPARLIVLFLDTLHLSGPSLIRSRLAAKQFVDEQVTDQDTVVIAASNGVFGVFQNAVRNRLALHRLIERINAFDADERSNFTPYLAGMVKLGDRTAFDLAAHILAAELRIDVIFARDMVRGKASEVLEVASYKRQSTLSVLSAVAERILAVPGQRLLILLSDGFSMRDFNGGHDTGSVQSVISKAVRSGVIIYSIDVKGLEVAAEFDASRRTVTGGSAMIGRLSSYMSASAKDRQDGINALAQDTGGKAFFNTNDLNGALQKAVDLNRSYYALAYYPPDDKGTKEFRRITVRVKTHPEYNVRAQKGYFASDLKKAEEKEQAHSPQQRLLTAIAKPLPVGEINVSASADYFEAGTDQVSLVAQIDGTSLDYRELNGRFGVELELTAVAYDRTGKPVSTLSETIRGSLSAAEVEAAKRNGFSYAKRMALKPGLYNVRLGLREARTDRIGTASTWVEVPDLRAGKLTISSIILLKDSTQPAPSPGLSASNSSLAAVGVSSYKRGSPIVYYLKIHNAIESDLKMQWEIVEAGKVIHQTEWQPVASRLIGRDDKGIEIGGQLALTLQPGLYELRISISDPKSRKTTQRAVPFAIEG